VKKRLADHYEPTVEYLRERVTYHRARAIETRNPVKAAKYRDIADILEREADAQQAEEAARSLMKRSA
jgi:hypothetical protein